MCRWLPGVTPKSCVLYQCLSNLHLGDNWHLKPYCIQKLLIYIHLNLLQLQISPSWKMAPPSWPGPKPYSHLELTLSHPYQTVSRSFWLYIQKKKKNIQNPVASYHLTVSILIQGNTAAHLDSCRNLLSGLFLVVPLQSVLDPARWAS